MARKPTPAAADQNAVNAAILETLGKINGRLEALEARDAEPRAADRFAQSRGGQSRGRQTRAAQEKIMPHMAYQSALWVDPTKIPQDKEYFWVRTSTLGEPDEANLTRHLRAGWSAVPASRHPELRVPTLPGRERPDTGVIELQGLILMEKPAALVQKAREWMQENNIRQLAAKMKGGNELNEKVGLHRDDIIYTADETLVEQETAFK